MLIVAPLKPAIAASEYYLNAIDYHVEYATATAWLGSGREFLKLSKNVDSQILLNLIYGKMPNGKKLRSRQRERQPGFYMTFSAPKSVSILAGLGIATEVIEFHDAAVEYALSQIESEFSETCVSKNNEIHYEKTGNLLAASFRQSRSRINEPALYTHCMTLNITFHNGEVKELANDTQRPNSVMEQIQTHAHYCGLLYRHHLARSLKEAGFSLRLTGDGLFEIDGINEEVLKTFSRDREDIELLMYTEERKQEKLTSKKCVIKRKKKNALISLKKEWCSRAKLLGFDAQQFMANCKCPHYPNIFL